jgi:two-component system KDP operon response regulator KdpE
VRKQLILVVDDEPPIVRLVRAKLQADEYAVITASRGEEALALLEDERPDLVVLDVMMPGMDGFETLRRIRQTSRVPVILLTARTSDVDKLKGLQGGADDYVTKPFNPDELAARVAAVLRRAGGSAPIGGESILRYPGREIDLEQRRVLVHGDEVRLSRTEWELLAQLATNAGRVMLHGELLSRIWGPEFRDEVHYLRTWVSRLRAKLEPDSNEPPLITTFPGLGYRLEPPPPADEESETAP